MILNGAAVESSYVNKNNYNKIQKRGGYLTKDKREILSIQNEMAERVQNEVRKSLNDLVKK